MIPSEAFLSHSSQDQEFVSKLAEVLRHHGIPVWYSKTNILGAQQWHDEIGNALKRCDWFLVVLSPNSVDSMWVKRELIFTLQQNRFENKIVPIIYQPCNYEQLSWVLSSFQMINFQEAFEDGCRDILRIWGVGYQLR
ncbi:toll/interleukin-1 receptor domain-containing protein [Nostoc sp. 'Lobaria pulmonaria (5183) cyanobiont']|uniref:toll/interleukin-1 receptor domain-containing protein n=1 Tax=Nostoc sp. 'Lobaria pulmonaria (5183) cyanobiont' TaxID=1618022 RepID=UPI000CF337B1|nr:toll/interleukin-1 receptor domain-containing protein [Nostoc sp. 'Lobaria pulmonaria (5183) cyanobiont']AVH73701.1 TIR domain-containing protein [Nostoc sp. 'Lobaria pulmonaria (5183) cyanobiont']